MKVYCIFIEKLDFIIDITGYPIKDLYKIFDNLDSAKKELDDILKIEIQNACEEWHDNIIKYDTENNNDLEKTVELVSENTGYLNNRIRIQIKEMEVSK